MIPVIAWVAAAAAGLLYVDANVKPLGLANINPLVPKRKEDIKPAAAPAAPIPTFVPGTVPGTVGLPNLPPLANSLGGFTVPSGFPSIPGTGQVDGKGTGVIPEAFAKSPGGVDAAAIAAAENMRMDIVNALNTAEGDRTPEQLALLGFVASVPIG